MMRCDSPMMNGRAICCLIAVLLTFALNASQVFADTITLSEAVTRALAFAPTLDSAQADTEMGRALSDAARAPLYPSISTGIEYMQAPGYNQVVSNGGLSTAQVLLDYTAFDFGRRMALLRAARYQSQAAAFGVPAAQAQVVFDVSVTFYMLLQAQHSEAELNANFERLGRYVSVVDSLLKTGRAISNDVLRVQTVRDSAELALTDARSNTQRAAATLAALIGARDDSNLAAADLPQTPPAPGGELSHNPTLAAAERRVASAKLAVQAALRERYPVVRLAMTAGWEGVNPVSTINRFGGASYDGAVAMPVFDGGLITSHIDQAQATLHSTEAQVRQVRLDLDRRMADAVLRYRQARDQLALLDRVQPTANDAFNLDWARFLGGGNLTLLEVMDAYQQAEQLRLARINQEFAERQASAEGKLLLGLAQ